MKTTHRSGSPRKLVGRSAGWNCRLLGALSGAGRESGPNVPLGQHRLSLETLEDRCLLSGSPVNSGLGLWLKADAGVTTDGSGGVSAWLDQSGAGHNAVQGNSNNRPVLVSGAFNGQSALRFNGVNDFLALAGQVLTSQAFTVLVVADDTRSAGDTSYREILSNWEYSNETTSVFLGTANQSPVRARFTDQMGGATDPHGSNNGVGAVSNPANPFILTGVNSASDATIDQNTSVLADNSSPISSRNLGTSYYVGTQGDINGEYWQGNVAEILVYNRALTSMELQQDWTYLQGKYSLLPHTTTTLATSANASTYGQPVTLTATVSAAAGTPTGSVTFSDGSTALGPPVAISNAGVATLTVPAFSAGTHAISSAYSGDSNFGGSTSTVGPNSLITTVAGNGAFGYGGDAGAATAAALKYPYGAAVDAAGDIFIADTSNSRIREVVKATGNIVTVAGTGSADFGGDGSAAGAAQVNLPHGLAVDSAGDVFIADTYNQRIREVIAATGNIVTVAGNGNAGGGGDGGAAILAALAYPTGVAVDAAGNLYIADQNNSRVREVNASTHAITTVAGGGSNPGTDGVGDGGQATAASLNAATAVALDVAGNIYIADNGHNRIRKVSALTGLISTVAGNGSLGFGGDGGLATRAALDTPTGVAVDAQGDIFIADQNNTRVREVLAGTGNIATVAGNGTAAMGGDAGPASAAAVQNPSGVAVDAAGGLFVVDEYNSRIREVPAVAQLTVTPATPTVSVSDAGGTYNGTPFPATGATVTGAGSDGTIAALGDPSLSYVYYQNGAPLAGAPVNAGNYAVVAEYAGNTNYTAAASAEVAAPGTPGDPLGILTNSYGSRSKAGFVLEVGRSMADVTAIDVLDIHSYDGPGGSNIVAAPAGSPYAYLIRNMNDGQGRDVTLGVVEATGFTISPAATTITAAASNAAYGNDANVALTAYVATNAPSSAIVNQGSVTFTITGNGHSVVYNPGPIVNGSVTELVDLAIQNFNPGLYSVNAVYTPPASNANFQASSSATPGLLTIAKLTPSFSTTPGGTVLAGAGVPLTDSATLTGGYDPTGTITFALTAPSGAVVDMETATVNGNGTYTTPHGYLPSVAGTYQWSAWYSGDAYNNGAAPPVSLTPTSVLSGLYDIYGVTTDTTGNVYVAESLPNRVAVFAPGSTTPSSFLTGISAPTNIIVDGSGDLFAGSAFSSQLVEFVQGSTTPVALGVSSTPGAMVFDGQNNLYVSESRANQIEVFAPGTTQPFRTLTGLSAPGFMGFDALGDLYVGNGGNNTVSEFAPGGTTPLATLTGVAGPQGLAVDSLGDVFVANGNASTISEFAPGSTTPSATLTGLSGPVFMTIDRGGNLYVTDNGNNTVSEFAPGSTTPTATLTGVNRPIGMAIDARGNLYVDNYGTASVSVFTPVTQPVTVKAMPTVSVSDGGGTYNGTPFPATGATVTGVGSDGTIAAFGDPSLSYVYYQNGAPLAGAPVDAGNYAVVAEYAGSSNYVAAASAEVAAPGTPGDPLGILTNSYGSRSKAGFVSEVGRSMADVTAIDVLDLHTYDGPGGSNIVAAPAGSPYAYLIRNMNDGQGRDVTLGVVEATGFTINKAPLAVTIGNDNQIEGSPANLVHDLGTTIATGVNGETLAIAYSSTGDTAAAEEGTCPISATVSNGSGLASNYNVTFTNGTLTINDAPLTATATPISDVEGQPLTNVQVATFTDANPLAPLSDFPLANVSINWGDGSRSNATAITQPGGLGTPFHVFGSHTYAEDGSSTVSLVIQDIGGATSDFNTISAGAVSTFASGLNGPNGLAFDGNGNLYVVDSGDGTISKVSTGGGIGTFASGFTSSAGLAFDTAGNLYVSYGANAGTIGKVTPSGAVSEFANYTTGLYYPEGLAFDSSGNLYAANWASGAVIKFAPSGVPSASQFNLGSYGASALAVDAAGNLYVANPWGGTVNEVSTGGGVRSFASGFNDPEGLAFDRDGNLYVTNARDNSVSMVTPGGVVSTLISSGLNHPEGLALDSNGNLFVSNAGDGTIAEISIIKTPTPITTTAAVADAPLTAGSLTPPAATEGQSFSNQTVFHFTDADPAGTVGDYTAVVTLGDRNAVTLTSTPNVNGQIVANTGGGFDVQLSYTYAEELTNAPFAVQVTDAGGASIAASTSVTSRSIGSSSMPRTNIDTSSGIAMIYAGDHLPAGVNVSTLNFYAGEGGLITPLLLEQTGARQWTLRGVGAARTITTWGVQSIPFDLQSGSSVTTNGNYTFGFINAAADANGQITATTSGVVSFDTTVDPGAGVSGGASTNQWVFTSGFGSPGNVSLGSLFGGSGVVLLSQSVDRTYSAGVSTSTFSVADAPLTASPLAPPSGTDTPAVSTFVASTPNPVAMAFDGAGNLYVGSQTTGRISKVTPDGVVSTFVAYAGQPYGLAFDRSGNLYVANAQNQIEKVTPDGTVSIFADAREGINNADSLIFDPQGDLYVGNGGNNTVEKITPAGVVSTVANAADGVNLPFSLALDGSGNLYIGNYYGYSITKVTPAGSASTFASVYSPTGLTFDARGNLYVASGSTVVRFDPSGAVSTFVDATRGINWAWGLAFDSAGNLYVSDYAGSSIVKVAPPPVAEGQAFSQTVFHFTDANANATAADYTALVTLGDGNTLTLTSTPNANGQIVANANGGFDVQLSHTYAEEFSNATFGVTVTDVGGATISASTNSFSVADAPLIAGALTPPAAVEGQPVNNATVFHFDQANLSQVIDADNFNEYTNGIQNATQPGTGLQLSFAGSLPGWMTSGFHAVHAVDLGNSNFAPMLFSDNSLTLNNAISANNAGTAYTVSFAAGPTTYGGGDATTASDGLVISVLRDDSTVLASDTILPGAWVTGLHGQDLSPYSFTYTGDGSGPVRIRIATNNPASSRFGGTIDNLSVATVGSTDTAADYTAVVTLGDGSQVTLTSAASANGQIVANANGGFDVQLSHTYAEELSNATFGIVVSDVGGATASVSTNTFSVADASLAATAVPVTTAVEGQAFSGEVATFTDGNPVAPLSDFPLANVTIQWGDGSTSNATSITQPGGPGTPFEVFGNHTYAEVGATANPLQVTITDVDGAISNTTTYTPTVADAPLSATSAITLASFNGLNGVSPQGPLLVDSHGNVFGVTGGAGTLFEIAAGSGVVTTLASFNGTTGFGPQGGLVEDANGDLFGTTVAGGPGGGGTVFELVAGSGVISTLADFNASSASAPRGNLLIDRYGNLFGATMAGGPGSAGIVFEVVAGSGAITTLASFNGANGASPQGGLVEDASGDLFGTTQSGGPGSAGTVFEVVAGSGVVTTLAAFNGANGAGPEGGLWRDAQGDLFGTTLAGGTGGGGMVYELAAGSQTITSLASFNGVNGVTPQGNLVEDANGDLFGTTAAAGPGSAGTLFEVVAGSGVASTLVAFNGTNGASPQGGLVQDSRGDLFGATLSGGAGGGGTIFEVPAALTPPVATEGIAFGPVTVFHFTDANPQATAADFTAVVALGDGNQVTLTSNPSANGGILVNGGGFDVQLNYTYADELSGATFSVQVSDAGGATVGSSTSAFSVVDAPLSAGALTPPVVAAGQSFSNITVFHFSDADPYSTTADYTATVTLGDGNRVTLTNLPSPNGQIVSNAGGFDVRVSHTYSQVLSNQTFAVQVQDVGGANCGANTTSFNVNRPGTSLTLAPLGNLTYGQPVQFSVHVTPAYGTFDGGGSVQFAVDGVAYGSPASLTGNTATIQGPSLPAGAHVISASYSGDGNFAPAVATLLGPNAMISTVAGTGVPGNSGNGGPASAAQINSPVGLALDAAGDVFFADFANNQVREIVAATGNVVLVAGNGTAGYAGNHGPASAAELNGPRGLALDAAGDLYIADYSNNRVREILYNGQSYATSTIVNAAGGAGGNGSLGDGGPATLATLVNPTGLAVDAAGNLYIADSGDHRIRKIRASTGNISTVTFGSLISPNGVTVDGLGDLLITDGGTNLVREWIAATGGVVTLAGGGTNPGNDGLGDGGPATVARLNNPRFIALDSAGDVFISDGNNNRVREINASTGLITTVAGTGATSSSGDGGPATAAAINVPKGLALDAAGDLYVADSGGNRIREIAAPRLVVSPALLTVTAANQTILAGSALPQFTASYSGLVNGDSSSVLSGGPSLSTTASASSPPGNYPIVAAQGTLAAPNYTFQFANGTLTIVPATSVVSSVPSAAGPTNAASLNYTVTFSQRVANMATGDFQLAGTGTAGGTVAAVSGNGSTYSVSVTSVHGDGSLRLDLLPGVLRDVNGFSVPGFTAGNVATIDHTAPVISATSVVTNDRSPAMNGLIDDPTATVSVLIGGVSYSAVNTGTDSWGLARGTISPALSDAQYYVTVTATDVAGNARSVNTTALIDTAAPTSRVQALARTQTTLAFAVALTATDPGTAPSGISFVSVYYSVDGSSTYSQWKNFLPGQTSDTFTLAQSNHTYSFYSVAHDVAGNVESKTPQSEASTYIPDLTPPDTHVVSPINTSTSTFPITFQGTDSGGSGMASFKLYVQLDSNPVQTVATVPAGTPTNGVYQGNISYQATADGLTHSYRFYTLGTDGAGNVETHQPAKDVVVSATFQLPPAVAVTSFVVQQAHASRSLDRYLDVTLNRTDTMAAMIASLSTASPDIRLVRYDLNGQNPVSVPVVASQVKAVDHVLSFDFGSGGVAGTAGSATNDGYYELQLDFDGNGTIDAREHFYRLMGDVNGDHSVTSADLNAIVAAYGQSGSNLDADVNNDGVVSILDRTAANKNLNHALKSGLPLDG